MDDRPAAFVSVLQKTHKVVQGWRMNLDHKVREPFELSMNELASLIDAALCNNQVRDTYVKKQLKRNDVFMLVFYEVNEPLRRSVITKRIPGAFLMAQKHELDDLYIDVICSGTRKEPLFDRHTGTMLLNLAIEHAKENRYRSVSLSALPHVLTYYPQFGFAHRPGCDQPADVLTPKSLLERAKNKTLPRSIDEAYEDEDVLNFMSELQMHNYGNKYEGECNIQGKNTNAVKKSLKEARCADDGFKMRLCFAPKRRSTRTFKK